MSNIICIALCLAGCMLQAVYSLPGGTVYTRWGRSTCPDGVTAVYKGQMAGAWYNQVGGGANYLCLPETPQWGATVAGLQYSAWVYGVEYETHTGYNFDGSPFSWANSKGSLYNQEAPCVVCFNPSKNHQLMVPARVNCSTDGWNTEYVGYLVANWYGHRRSEFICMDGAPEILDGSKPSDENGMIVVPVQTDCAYNNICPPYASGSEFACAVCSK